MPGVLEVIPQIRLPMGVWANTHNATADDVKQWLSRADLDRHFKWIVTSSDIGFRKPDERFFVSALTGCGKIVLGERFFALVASFRQS